MTCLPFALFLIIKRWHGEASFKSDYGTLRGEINTNDESRLAKYWCVINLIKIQVMILTLVYLRDYPGISIPFLFFWSIA